VADAVVCEAVRASISARADGEDVTVDRGHVEGCAGCAAFESGVRSLRGALRFDVLDDVPDVATAVLARVTPRRRRPRYWLPAAAVVVVVAGVVGGVLVWPSDEPGIGGVGGGVAEAAPVAERVVDAQDEVASVAATLVVTDTAGPRRGTLRYRAPESLELALGDTRVLVGDGAWRVEGPDGVDAHANVEPFAPGAPSPLDLVLPVSAFLVAGTPELLGERDAAVGVRVPAAQVAALLEGIGTEVHPSDPVDLWLDAEHLVPLEVTVRAGEGPDRARWAAARGIESEPGDVVLSVAYEDVRVNDALAVDGLAAPATDGAVDGGFRPGPSDEPVLGMQPWRSGTVGDVTVRSWTDGRAWVKVRSTTTWTGTRLFGGLGAVRAVRLGDGVAYVADGGRTIALHADGIDLVLTGSVAPETLRRFAVELGVVGERVPATWDEAAVVDVDDVDVVPRLLLLGDGAGFEPPAVRVDGDTVTATFAGAGERVVVLTTRVDDALRPPLDPDAVGVVARGTTARWSPTRGDLEWVEGGQVWSLRSSTVGLPELVALADGMGRDAVASSTVTTVAVPTEGSLLVWVPGGLPAGFADGLRTDAGLGATTVVLGDTVQHVASGGRRIPLDAIAVDCASWSAVVPVADAAAVCRLREDEVLLGTTSATLRGIGPGGVLELANGRVLRVAGVVDDAIVGAAELVLPRAGAAAAGVATERYVLATFTGDRADAEARIRALTDVGMRVRGPGETPWLRHGDAVLPQSHLKRVFGEFAAVFRSDGRLEIDPAWQAANLVTVDLPIVGSLQCHRALVDALAGALGELEQRGLVTTIDRGAAGCWNPRVIAGTDQPSRHAWGAAFDLLPLPSGPTLDAVVEVFERWGFTWGGRWVSADPVHFEYVGTPS